MEGGWVGGRGYFTRSREPFERQRKIGEWKERDEGERRVVIERKDLFDITREREREGGRRG